jgi:hypothetical protein
MFFVKTIKNVCEKRFFLIKLLIKNVFTMFFIKIIKKRCEMFFFIILLNKKRFRNVFC